MAQGQHDLEQRFEANPLFFDTNLYVFKVWIEEKYQTNVEWIEQHLSKKTTTTICFAILIYLGNPTHFANTPTQKIDNAYLNVTKHYYSKTARPFL
jgi:hypothetical protein